jgi:hypothetical protein
MFCSFHAENTMNHRTPALFTGILLAFGMGLAHAQAGGGASGSGDAGGSGSAAGGSSPMTTPDTTAAPYGTPSGTTYTMAPSWTGPEYRYGAVQIQGFMTDIGPKGRIRFSTVDMTSTETGRFARVYDDMDTTWSN